MRPVLNAMSNKRKKLQAQIPKLDIGSAFKHSLACWAGSVTAFQCFGTHSPLQAREETEIMMSFLGLYEVSSFQFKYKENLQ